MTGFRDRLTWDAAQGEWRDGAIRYMMIRPDALMGILHELPEPRRAEVLDAFARSIARAGGHSARAYQAMGAAQADALLATIQATAPELGWGIWTLRRDGEGLALEVRNSPFVAGYGRAPHPVCHPIRGMLSAVGGLTLGGPAEAEEAACAAAGAPCCRFRARRVDAPEPLPLT